MGTSSVIEVCAAYMFNASAYRAIDYVGDPSGKAYLINKGPASGISLSGSKISDDSQINWIAMDAVSNLSKGSAAYCGPNATSATCAGASWPAGLVSKSACNEAKPIASTIPDPPSAGNNFCITGCNDNTFLNASDPNTLEYDNLVSTYHSSIAKQMNGDFKIWGEGAGANNSNLLSPTTIEPTSSATPATNFNYGTSKPLKVTGGSDINIGQQFALLTTDGLYVWGKKGYLISTSILNSSNFTKITVATKADGLPPGVSPTDVKMMFGSYRTLAITTCTGEAWVLSMYGSKDGDGTSGNTGTSWKRVKTDASTNLTNVVAMRGTPTALFALTSTGKLYTWGKNTYINSGVSADRTYATEVTVPTGVIPKMIGMTQGSSSTQTYYLLASDGRLFSMGNNGQKQLGIGSTTDSTTWVQPQKPSSQGQGTGDLVGIVYISPNEHDNYEAAAINVLTTTGKQWAWGTNSGGMIGGSSSSANYEPLYQPGGLGKNDYIIALETGGHTSLNIKQCSVKFGYVGHQVNGSMGDGTNVYANPTTYSYLTGDLAVCGATTTPEVDPTLKMCSGMTVDLNDAHSTTVPSNVTLEWWTTATRNAGTQVANPIAVGPGTYYAFYIPNNTGTCSAPTGVKVVVSYYTSADPEFASCKYGYLYITKKALDENSSVDFNFTINGGPISTFKLNDKETTLSLVDAGASQDGRLWTIDSSNNLYYRNLNDSKWIKSSVTNAKSVDGASGTGCYFVGTDNKVYLYDGVMAPVSIGAASNFGSNNPVDVGSAWNNKPYIIAGGKVYQYSGSGTTWSQVGATTDNFVAIDANPITGDALVTDGTTVSLLTSTGVKTSLGAVGDVTDVAVSSSGEIFRANVNGFVRKWNSGTTWDPDEVSSRFFASRVTAGNRGQVWAINNYVTMLSTIHTRVQDGTTVFWLDDERVRTTVDGNSVMIKVPVGTYTIKENATTNWELQDLQIYDPSTNSTKDFANQSVVLNVSEDETVHAVFTNGLVKPFSMGIDCAIAFGEDFGSGNVGTFGAPLTGQTSYHYSNADGSTPAEDGYYKVVGQSSDFAWWATAINDHTSGDGKGRFMAINASYAKDIFFRRRFTNLIVGKGYSFSAWLASLSNDVVKPNATFKVIDPSTGTVLGNVSTGDITTAGVWQKYEMTFVASSTEIDLVLDNNSIGGSGNDIALDDITFKMSPPAVPSVVKAINSCDPALTTTITIQSPLGAIYEYSLDGVTWQSSPVFSNVPASTPSVYVKYVGSTTSCGTPKFDFPPCFCTNDPVTTGIAKDTKVGITLLKRAGSGNTDNWPMVRKGGHIALESNTQGFVPTRMTTAQLNAIKLAGNAVDGMMSYDTDAKCLKIYDGTDWKCFSTPSCP